MGLHSLQEQPRGLALEQPLRVLGKRRGVPNRLVGVQTHEPAEQHVGAQVLHQLPLDADRVQNHQQQHAKELLGRDRLAADRRVHRPELWLARRQHRVHRHPDVA